MSKHFHFIGIGGIGMGTIASLLLAQGHQVSGSDLKENQVTARLKKEGANITIGHHGRNVKGAGCVVFSSAVSDDNPEILTALAQGIPVIKRAEMLAQLMNTQTGITVAGAHGKTTTTSMISNLLIQAGFDPTTAVGGIINNGSYNANLGAGKYFVAEVDESDGSFLYFSPYYSVITNIDFEHVDFYHTWDNITRAYQKFIKQTDPEGTIFAFGEDKRLRSLLAEAKAKTKTYGFLKENDIYAENIVLDGYFSQFDCVSKGKTLGTVYLKVPGRHNILNALATIGVGLALGIDFSVISQSLKEYGGVQRRFQFKSDANDIFIVDDYGHHPTEIKAVLEAAKSFKRARVITVFQPHRYSRTKFLMDEFVTSLAACDYLVLTDIYAASEEPIEGVSTQQLYEKVKASGKTPVLYLKKEDIVNHLIGIVKPGDMVITLGAGDITKISDELAEVLTPAGKKTR